MNNKLLLVTGGNQGIGKSIVIEALNSGYKVAFTYNSNEKEALEFVKRVG